MAPICCETVCRTVTTASFLIAALTTAILLPMSYHKTDEGFACVLHNNVTGWVGDEVISMAQQTYTGLQSKFICMRTTLEHLSFSQDGKGMMGAITARTKQGLPIVLELDIEYQVDVDSVIFMMEHAGISGESENGNIMIEPRQKLIPVARSVLRNTASRYEALEFLSGQRESISAAMFSDVQTAFRSLKTTVNRCNIKKIQMPNEFRAKFRQVETLQLQVKVATENLALVKEEERSLGDQAMSRLQAQRKLDTQTARLQVSREKSFWQGNTTMELARARERAQAASTQRHKELIEQAALVEEAQARKETKVQEAQREAIELKHKLQTARANMHLEEEGKLAEARMLQNKTLTKALNDRKVALATVAVKMVEHAQQMFMAEAQHNATKSHIAADGTMAAAQVTRDNEKIRREMQGLLDTVGLTPEQVAQWMWYKSMGNNEDLTNVFLDYDKVPMLAEYKGPMGDLVTTVPAPVTQ